MQATGPVQEVGSIGVSGGGNFGGDVDVGGTISGNGSGISNVDASSIFAGTLDSARLASDVPRSGAANTFTATNTFGLVVATAMTQGGSAVCDASNNCSYATSASMSNVLRQGGNSFGATLTVGSNDAQATAIRAGGSDRLTVLSSGQVGVGTASPSAKFEVNAGNTKNGLRVGDASLSRYVTLGYQNAGSPFEPGATNVGFLAGPDGLMVTDSNVAIDTRKTTYPSLLVRAIAGQTADLLSLRSSASNVLMAVDKSGNATTQSLTVNGPTLKLSPNSRGIDVAVVASATSVDVVFSTPQASTAYATFCTPGWDTTCFVTAKTNVGFTLNFGAPAPVGATVDWFATR